jgi:hypothetical protein
VRACGDDDPVVRCTVGEAETTVSADDAQLAAGFGERKACPAGELAIELDRDDAAPRPDDPRQECSVVAGSRPDLEHTLSFAKVKAFEHECHDRRL